LKSSLAGDGVVVPGHVDDRHGNVRHLETVPQLYARNIAEVDIEKDTKRLVEVIVIAKASAEGNSKQA
jgi:hypothetical protein